jgi:uncharacterized protein (UPF0128 family)
MPLLSSSELAQLRADIADLLPDTCRVERMSASNTGGYVTETWGTAIASTTCRIDPDTRRSDADIVADREAGISRYIATFQYDTDLRDGDRIVYSGNTYQVTELHTEHSMNGSVRARVTRVEGG